MIDIGKDQMREKEREEDVSNIDKQRFRMKSKSGRTLREREK